MRPLVVLTGATRGIGRAAAAELARQGADVALVGREPSRLAATAAEVRAAAPDAAVFEHRADFERLDDVRRLAAGLLEQHERIDVLANNAGAMFSERRLTPDGHERTLQLNHLAPFLLTQLLLDRLRASEGSRVVTTASDAHGAAHPDLDDLGHERSFKPMRTYGTSKLWNVLFTRELARRCGGHPTATCFHPGVVRTGFGKNEGVLWRVITTAGAPFFRSPASGADSLVWLALSPQAAALDGVYVVDRRVATPRPAGVDDDLAAALWQRTAALVGL